MIIIFVLLTVGLIEIINKVFHVFLKKNNAVHLRFFKSVINFIVIFLAVYCLLQQFEITKDISKTILQSGSLIIAIATFAAQQALGNIISGFSLSLSKPYNLKEKIKVIQNGNIVAEGIVEDITIRHTVIRQYNGETYIVPNSVMDSAIINNTNYTENIGNFIEVEISYESDIELAMKLMQQICIEHILCLNTNENKVFVKDYTSNGVILKTTIWTKTLDDSFIVCSDIRKSLIKIFKENNIEIPYQKIQIIKE